MVWVGGELRGGEARQWVAGGGEGGYGAEVRLGVNQRWSSGKRETRMEVRRGCCGADLGVRGAGCGRDRRGG